MAKNKKKRRFTVIFLGMTTVIRLLVYIFAALVIIISAMEAYRFGYGVFNQEAVSSEAKAVEVSVTITDTMSLKDIGELLRTQGLIEETSTVFQVQAIMAGYKDGFPAGTYTLKTSQTVDQMMKTLAGEEEE